jgi:5-methylcytosine-specific restriction endonuclease McrA
MYRRVIVCQQTNYRTNHKHQTAPARLKEAENMNKKRKQVYEKYNGRCAYTGKPLVDGEWQIDHMTSRYKTKCNAARSVAEKRDWSAYQEALEHVNDIDNLLPSLRIVNHYKRLLDLEGFREYMLTFHKRLAKLPKRTNSPSTARRIIYMNKIADAFGITIEKPFNGIFYFETLLESPSQA